MPKETMLILVYITTTPRVSVFGCWRHLTWWPFKIKIAHYHEHTVHCVSDGAKTSTIMYVESRFNEPVWLELIHQSGHHRSGTCVLSLTAPSTSCQCLQVKHRQSRPGTSRIHYNDLKHVASQDVCMYTIDRPSTPARSIGLSLRMHAAFVNLLEHACMSRFIEQHHLSVQF
jgi:hypothetical protein